MQNILSNASSSVMVERSITSSTHHATINSTHANKIRRSANSPANINCIITHQSLFDGKHNFYQQLRSLATRRRRRQGGGTLDNEDDSEDNSNSTTSSSTGQSPALSSEQFLSVSNSLLDKVESAITKLKDCNDGLEITRYPPSTTGSAGTTSSDTEDEEDENSKPQQHGGQLSIQVESSGDFFWGGGTYWLTINPDDSSSMNVHDNSDGDGSQGSGGVISLRSPLSGSFSYVYDASSGEWVGSEDGHSLIGMLTRDWIRQCRGVPDF